MISVPGIPDFALWGGFILLILVFLFLDLFVFNKKHHVVTIKEALLWSLFWFSIAMIFNVFVWYKFGPESGLQFLTGYLIEEALSMDNLFVILVIMTAFKIAPKFQHRVLFWGIIGAIVFRGIMILAGAALVKKFDWIFYIFGIFIIYTGYKMLFKQQEDFNPHDSWIVKIVKKVFHVSRNHDTEHFFTMENGKRAVTLLFVALMVVEITDILFAFDSIPAIFAITTDPFIVFTSNIFAILGLRSLYFVIARAHDLFHYLNIGLAIILVFIGTKMLLHHEFDIPIGLSLGIVVGVLALSIIASIIHKKQAEAKKH